MLVRHKAHTYSLGNSETSVSLCTSIWATGTNSLNRTCRQTTRDGIWTHNPGYVRFRGCCWTMPITIVWYKMLQQRFFFLSSHSLLMSYSLKHMRLRTGWQVLIRAVNYMWWGHLFLLIRRALLKRWLPLSRATQDMKPHKVLQSEGKSRPSTVFI